MRNHDPQTMEDGFHTLLPKVDQVLDDLIAALDDPINSIIADVLVELIGDSKRPEALPVLIENLYSENRGRREWAMLGLLHWNTKESRQALRDARHFEFPSPVMTAEFQELIERAIGPEQVWEKRNKRYR